MFLGLVIGEGLLRLAKPAQLFISHQPCIYLEDQEIGYVYKKNAVGWMHRNFEMDTVVKINSLGFHDSEHGAVNGKVKILAIGDSFTSALHVPISEGWTQVLQNILQNQTNNKKVEVFNLGIDGTGTDAQAIILKRYAEAIRPDVVILSFYENDINDVLFGHKFRECYAEYVLIYQNAEQQRLLRRFVDIHQSGSWQRWLFFNSYAYRLICSVICDKNDFMLLRNNVLSPAIIGLAVKEQQVTANVDGAFQQLLLLAEEYHFKLLVVPVPEKNNIALSIDTLKKNTSAVILKQLQVVDVSTSLPALLKEENKKYDQLFWKYDGHFNSYGNHSFAVVVSREIEKHIRFATEYSELCPAVLPRL
ncbi:MAG: SGNH/GDSL hydrolase family protein [Desulfobulbaceae bacterium]|nr:SGNH/GDSL hydrolase family protein [Desulfobulbaceae bacterium]